MAKKKVDQQVCRSTIKIAVTTNNVQEIKHITRTITRTLWFLVNPDPSGFDKMSLFVGNKYIVNENCSQCQNGTKFVKDVTNVERFGDFDDRRTVWVRLINFSYRIDRKKDFHFDVLWLQSCVGRSYFGGRVMSLARVRVNEFYVLNQVLSRSPSIAADDLMACAMLGEFCGERLFLRRWSNTKRVARRPLDFCVRPHGLDALTPDTPVSQQRAMAESIYADGRWLFYCVDLDLQPLARTMVEGFVRKLLEALPQEAKKANYPNDWLTREGYAGLTHR